MGCDIHCFVEKKVGDKWVELNLEPFDDFRSYGAFGFLANVRNYSQVPFLSDDRGIPEGSSLGDYESYQYGDYHSASWLSVLELTSFDYSQTFEDRRSGGQTLPLGEGKVTTFRDFLGACFFKHLEAIVASGADRIVFWFDN